MQMLAAVVLQIQKKVREHRRKMRKVAKNKDGPVRKSKMRLGAFIPIVAAGAAAAVTVLLLRWSSTAMFHLWLGPLGWLVAVAGAAAATSSVTAAAYGHSEFRRDPGIPNSYPFKAELLANIARQKQEREEQLQREREQRKQQKQQQRQQRQEQSEAAAAAVQADGATDAEALQRIADKAAAATTTFEAATAAGPSGSSRSSSHHKASCEPPVARRKPFPSLTAELQGLRL